MANGVVPYADMPSTYMLLEKMREGSAPKLYDSTTYESIPLLQHDHDMQNNQDLVFSGQKPADSGVGASVGSCSNLPAAKQNSKYNERTFSDHFHDFVDQCCLRDSEARQAASQLLAHPFIKQVRKSSSSSGSAFASSLLLSVNGAQEAAAIVTDEDSLTMTFHSKMVIDEVQWEF